MFLNARRSLILYSMWCINFYSQYSAIAKIIFFQLRFQVFIIYRLLGYSTLKMGMGSMQILFVSLHRVEQNISEDPLRTSTKYQLSSLQVTFNYLYKTINHVNPRSNKHIINVNDNDNQIQGQMMMSLLPQPW